ncbi:MAG: hypothetical protein JWO94_613 [Verrucomicrobiaceae bacterium]|nr:hypothetical protein [Verrucomicrobiaceae bacterium]
MRGILPTMPSLLAFCSGALGLLLFCTSAAAQSPTLSLDLGEGVKMDFVLVQAGHFTQGSPAGEVGRQEDEAQREVTLSHDFYMAKTPVTRGQFARFAAITKFRSEAEKGPSGGFGVVDGKLEQRAGFSWRQPGFAQTDDHPVVMLTYNEAQSFARWLTARAHRQASLPTEAQWEYAVRAGSTGPRYAEPVTSVALYRGNAGGTTRPVGQSTANAWGISDAYGPVWQWCSDWYAPYAPGRATDPEQTAPGTQDKPRRVLRGGSLLSDVSHARSAARYRNDPLSRNADNGFRLVCAVNELPAGSVTANTQPLPTLVPAYPHDVPPAETPLQPLSGSSSSGLGMIPIIVIGFFMLIGGTVLYKLVSAIRGGLRGMSSSMPGAASGGLSSLAQGARFSTRIGPDGFWITGPAASSGQPLHYSYVMNGQQHEERILFTPGPEGHFIFTGSKPTTVAVRSDGGTGLGLTSNSVFDSGSLGRGMMMGRIGQDVSTPDSSLSSFPPAY